MKSLERPPRILAIDPCHKGFGFALFGTKGTLLRWGVAWLWSNNDQEFLARIEAMIDLRCPTLIVVEDVLSTPLRDRAKRRIKMVTQYAKRKNIPCMVSSRSEVRLVLGLSNRAEKQEIAIAIAEAFPELKSLLPQKRKKWESERLAMNVFDAVALVVVALNATKQQTRPDL